MNDINPKKLRDSKWTAVKPVNKEKHFIVTKVTINDDNRSNQCSLQSLLTKRVIAVDWQELENPEKWIRGWK